MNACIGGSGEGVRKRENNVESARMERGMNEEGVKRSTREGGERITRRIVSNQRGRWPAL
jgi:hypothetical protein